MKIQEILSRTTQFNAGPGTVLAFRVGELKDFGRGIFFALNEEGADAYQGRHGDLTKTQYQISYQNALISKDHYTLYADLFPGDTFNEAVSRGQHDKFGPTKAAVWNVETKMAAIAREHGHDVIIYTSPPPPATAEIAVIGGKRIQITPAPTG